jgi:hypothetical protein
VNQMLPSGWGTTSLGELRRFPLKRVGDNRHRTVVLVADHAAREMLAGEPAPVDRCAVERGPGLERPGPVSGVERYPQQPPTALDRGERSGQRIPHAVEQQQRQHLRFSGPAASPPRQFGSNAPPNVYGFVTTLGGVPFSASPSARRDPATVAPAAIAATSVRRDREPPCTPRSSC